MGQDPRLIGYVVTAVVVGLVLIMRLQRMRRVQPLRVKQLWVAPLLIVGVAVLILIQAPPAPGDWPWLVLGLAVGGGLGWVRGKMMSITVEPQTQRLMVKASPTALIFLLVLMAGRIGLRAALASVSASWHISVGLVTDGFILFAVALIAVQRLEMGLRARRLLADARQSGPN